MNRTLTALLRKAALRRVALATALFLGMAGLCLGVLHWATLPLSRVTFVPIGAFKPLRAFSPQTYAREDMWIARPQMAQGRPADPAQWLPPGVARQAPGDVPVFFVHPTSFLGREHWNDPLDNHDARLRTNLLVAATGSPFNQVGPVWAPRYRQAAFGAFLDTGSGRGQALDLAYGDVRAAFAAFLAAIPPDSPFILAGHSQGGLMVTRLLHDTIARRDLSRRLVVAYVIGWPIAAGKVHDDLGLAPCAGPDQIHCLVAWMSFAEPADPHLLFAAYDDLPAGSANDTPLVCVNPLSGGTGSDPMPSRANRGTLLFEEHEPALIRAEPLRPAMVPARCDPRGLLLIGQPPQMGLFVLPGNTYHVYDIPLFWANLRADTVRRSRAWPRPRDGETG